MGNVLAKKIEYFGAKRTEQKNKLEWIRKYTITGCCVHGCLET